MKILIKSLIPIALTLLGLEIGSRIVAYQPIATTYKKLYQNGVKSNLENDSAIHEFWNNGIKTYMFSDYANRISSNALHDSNRIKRIRHEDSCNYLLLGDSLSFGYLVDYEETFPTLIEAYFNNSKIYGKSYAFINAASPG